MGGGSRAPHGHSHQQAHLLPEAQRPSEQPAPRDERFSGVDLGERQVERRLGLGLAEQQAHL